MSTSQKNAKNTPKHYTRIQTEKGKFRFNYFDGLKSLHRFCAEHDDVECNIISSRERMRSTWCKRSYDEWLDMCSTLKGLERDIESINTLVDEVGEYNPHGRNYKRKRTMASHGVSINTQRALRGDFSHAWRGFRRETSMNGYGVITVLVNCAHPSNAPQEAIFWCVAAVIALADYLEKMGRETEVYTINASSKTYDYAPENGFILTRIKTPGEAWNIHAAALTSQSEYLRRSHFRVLEIAGGQENRGGYGRPMPLTQELVAPFCEHMNIQGEPILGPMAFGAGMVYDKESAIAWIKKTVESIDNE